jgi:hypothetical protein
MSLWTLTPAASGNTQSWTPNTVANIAKTVINDATVVSTATNNALSEWTVPSTPPSGIFNVLDVVQNARVAVSGTGPQHFDWLARTGAIPTDILAGAPAAPMVGSFANFQHRWGPNNPVTGIAWSMADLTAAGFNLGIESQA